jgi:hypothetical protein
LAQAHDRGRRDGDCADEDYDFARCIFQHAVIAWKMEGDYPVALTADGDEDNAPYRAIVEPSGRVMVPLDTEFRDLAEWTAAVRSTWLRGRKSKKKTVSEAAE